MWYTFVWQQQYHGGWYKQNENWKHSLLNTWLPPIETSVYDCTDSATDTTTMTLHHTRCQEEKAELYHYHLKYIIIVPGSALTHNCRLALEFKLRSQGIRLTCSSLLSCLAVCLYQSVTSDELPGTRPGQDWGYTEREGVKARTRGGGGFVSGLLMRFGMGIWKQQLCLLKLWWRGICSSINSEKGKEAVWVFVFLGPLLT